MRNVIDLEWEASLKICCKGANECITFALLDSIAQIKILDISCD